MSMTMWHDTKRSEYKKKFIEELTGLILGNTKEHMLLMLSGGSAIDLYNLIPTKIIKKNITITVVDERFDSSPTINNFSQISKTRLYEIGITHGVSFISTHVKATDNLADFSNNYEKELRNWFDWKQSVCVIAILGIGLDGHTAGIIPFDLKEEFDELFEQKKWVIGYNAGLKNQYPLRMTVTNTFLRQYVDHALVIAMDKNKNSILERIFFNRGNMHELPGLIINKMKDVQVFSSFDPDK